jgi:signal transduction histidine kinase
VIVLTSSQDEDLREELFSYGIIDYIIKDSNLIYSIHEMVKVINTLQRKNKTDILIIDDSKFICKQVKTILEPRNYNIDVAYSALEGVQKLNKNNYSLLILDMELPDMHGLKVLEKIRKNKRHLNLPIVVLSGTTTQEIIREILKYGANDFMKKPFVTEEFILRVDLWVDYYNKEVELTKKTKELKKLNKELQKIVEQKVQEIHSKEKMMVIQSRHAQMGEMLAMIAHQWRQPLNAIGAATGVVTMKAKNNKLSNEIALEIAQKVRKYVQYLSDTIDDFRDFFKPQKEIVSTDMEIILTKTLSIIADSLENNGIKLHITKKSVKKFQSHENEITQVVLNILKNAEDAFLQRNIKDPLIKITIQENELFITDNAGGIDKKIINKIFDPYFSTKNAKEGTGLGLYMSKIIIEEHCNGKIELTSNDIGTTFHITLPALKESKNEKQ